MSPIRWFVYVGDRERIPAVSTMRGAWPGYDVVCTLCGWESRTGGGVRRWVRELAQDHLFDEHRIMTGPYRALTPNLSQP